MTWYAPGSRFSRYVMSPVDANADVVPANAVSVVPRNVSEPRLRVWSGTVAPFSVTRPVTVTTGMFTSRVPFAISEAPWTTGPPPHGMADVLDVEQELATPLYETS